MSVALTGRGTAPGAAVGPAFVVGDTGGEEPLPERAGRPADEEQQRLADALERAASELRGLADRVSETAGPEEAEIFAAHAEFATDPELTARADEAIAEGASAEVAVSDAFESFRELLAASSSEYLAARAEDLTDVRDRVVRILTGRSTGVAAPEEVSVIAAETLSPSQTAAIPRELIAGIVTAGGSPTSHAAILARSLGIPAVVACTGLLGELEAGRTVALDGSSGEVVIAPTTDEQERFERRASQHRQRRAQLRSLRDEPGRTADGHRIELAANLGGPDDLPAALEAGAEGSGLVRTEFLFQDRQQAPDAAEQVAYYREVLEAFPGERVVFRTLDVGADKPLPFVPREAEDNPALGVRGLRLSLTRPPLLRTQLRALLRTHAAADDGTGDVAVMFPLVSTATELERAREVLADVADEEGLDPAGPEVGIMVEVPAAALAARRLAHRADFFSVGTNDLLQYLFAADRLNAQVAHLPDVAEPAVLELLRSVADACHDADGWVGVCGETAGDPIAAAAFVGLGVDELSMSPVALPEVKATLRAVTRADCRDAVETAIADAADGGQARRILRAGLDLPETGPPGR